jgi:hypothetical protein
MPWSPFSAIFSQYSENKLAFFMKTNPFFHNLAVFFKLKYAHYSRHIFLLITLEEGKTGIHRAIGT